MNMRYGYKTIMKDGKAYRYRTYWQNFKDDDTGELVPIKRHQLIKIDGEKVVWIPSRRKP